MMDIIPIFSSHFSIGSSILTLDEPTEYSETSPNSIFTLAQKYKINNLYLADTSISGLIQAYKSAEIAKINLRYGLKIVCCGDSSKKDEDSLKTEHQIIIWILNSNGINDLYRLSTKISTDGFYYVPRIDQKVLKELMTDNLSITIPFYNGFIASNLLSFKTCLFDCEYFKPTFFIENNKMPFDNIIKEATLSYVKNNYKILNTKSIFYETKKEALVCQARRCIDKRSTLECPNLEHFSSDEFCLEALYDN